MSDQDQDLAYWRELALAYRRELEALHQRIRQHPELYAATIQGHGWMNEIDRIARTGELKKTEAVAALNELWQRVAAEEQK